MNNGLGRLLLPTDDDIVVRSGDVVDGGGVFQPTTIKPIASTVTTVVAPAPVVTPQVIPFVPTPAPVNDAAPLVPGIVQGSPKIQANVGASSAPSATVSSLVPDAKASVTLSTTQDFIDTTKSNLVQAAQNAGTAIKNDPKKTIMIVGGVLLVSGILYAATRKKTTTT